MVSISAGMLAMGIAGSGVPLAIALGLTGGFLWAVQDVVNATAMDAAQPGTEGTVVGLMFTSTFLGGALAPLVAGVVVSVTGERSSVFFMSAVVMMLTVPLLVFAPLRRRTLVM
jgi:MFS family permease